MEPEPGLGVAGLTTMGAVGATPQMEPGSDVTIDENPLKTNRVRFDADFVLRQYICSMPEPDVQQRGVWTWPRTCTRVQHRAASALAAQQSITASPFSVQTQQPVRRTLYTPGISTGTQTTTPSTVQATSPGGITTAVQTLTIMGEALIPRMSTAGSQGAVGGTQGAVVGAQGAVGGAQGAVGGATGVTPTVSPTKGKISSAFDKIKQKFQKKDK